MPFSAPPPPKMEIKLIQKINLRKDGNRRTPPPTGGHDPLQTKMVKLTS